jgi:hypothetical protein
MLASRCRNRFLVIGMLHGRVRGHAITHSRHLPIFISHSFDGTPVPSCSLQRFRSRPAFVETAWKLVTCLNLACASSSVRLFSGKPHPEKFPHVNSKQQKSTVPTSESSPFEVLSSRRPREFDMRDASYIHLRTHCATLVL